MQSNLEKQLIENYYKAKKLYSTIEQNKKNDLLFDYVQCIETLKKAVPYRDSEELLFECQKEMLSFIENKIEIDDYALVEIKDAIDCIENEALIPMAEQCFEKSLQKVYQFAIQLDNNFSFEDADTKDTEYIYDLFEDINDFKDVKKYLTKYKKIKEEDREIELEVKYALAIKTLDYENKKIKKIIAKKKYHLIEINAKAQLKVLKELPLNYKKTKEYIKEAEYIITCSKASAKLSEKKTIKNLIITSILVIVVIISGIIASVSFTKNHRYQNAIQLYESQNYREAKTALLNCKGYKDSKEIYDKIKYIDLQKGDIITIGRTDRTLAYWEEGFRKKHQTDIDWIVLEVDEEKALLLSTSVIGFHECNFSNENYFKELNELRFKQWFSENDQNHILLTKSLEGKEEREVNFFALTLEQYTKFANDSVTSKVVKNSQLLPHNIAFLKKYDDSRYTGMNLYRDIWYLATRSEEDEDVMACVKIEDGEVIYESTNRYKGFYMGVRPAIYVKIDK